MSEEDKVTDKVENDAVAASNENSEVEEKPQAVTAEDLLKEGLEVSKIRKAKGSKNITHGEVHVLATFNNTKVCFMFSKYLNRAVFCCQSGVCFSIRCLCSK